MNRAAFFFELPPALIAQSPLPVRSDSRLLVLDKQTGRTEHRQFFNVGEYLRPGDCLVLNDSKVIPARLLSDAETPGFCGVSASKRVEMLLHERLDDGNWTALFKPGKKARPGDTLSFGNGSLTARVLGVTDGGLRVVALEHAGGLEPLLEKIGAMPLPPYIHSELSSAEEKERYQTVYAAHSGSVAAPTAGLHFTPELLKQMEEAGVKIARVTLHVGLGTFRPVKADNILEHHMHSEYFHVAPGQAEIINEAKRRGGRVISVGTTSCRTLESCADGNGTVMPGKGRTDIFIYPGYLFKIIDGMITNFHLPESTLIMLVSALAGRGHVLAAYREAVGMGYRFFSFGDAMLIL